MGLLRSGLVTGGLLITLGVAGCVTGGQTQGTSDLGASGDQSQPAAPTPEDTAAVTSDGVALAATESPDAIDWQRVLVADAEAIEARGSGFLDASFVLYNELLSLGEPDGKEGGGDPDLIERAFRDSAARYGAFVDAVLALRADLGRDEVKKTLRVDGDSVNEQMSSIAAVFSSYNYKPQANAVGYNLKDGASVTKMLFGSEDSEREASLAELPKAQRDALLLLDQLKRVSGDMAMMSSTVTAWVHDVEPLSLGESFVH